MVPRSLGAVAAFYRARRYLHRVKGCSCCAVKDGVRKTVRSGRIHRADSSQVVQGGDVDGGMV